MNRVASEIAVPMEIESDTTLSMTADLIVLTKARLTLLVLITTFVGFCWATDGAIDWLLLLNTLLGTALVAASAQVLNQVIEKHVDRLMERTKNRPLPTGRMCRRRAAVLGVVLGAMGITWLALMVNLTTTLLAAATLLIYLLAYTPLKRRTPLCIAVGAVAGAIPPMIGWAALQPAGNLGSWILFGILFCWQMPHFLAIAWMYRDEYAAAGFVMLRRRDHGGFLTALESLAYTILLTAVTLLPWFLGMANLVYLIGASVFDLLLFICAVQFLIQRTRPSARRLFLASILYLPVLLGLLVFTRA